MKKQKTKDNLDVLIVGSNCSLGGISQYINQQAEHLSDRADVRIYDTESPNGSGYAWLILAIFQNIFNALKYPFRHRPDLVHIHSAQWFSFYRATFYIVISKYVWRVPVVLHIHGSSFDEFLTTNSFVAQTIQQIGFGVSSQVIALSDYWRVLIETHSNASDVIAIPNAVDPTKYDSSPRSDKPTIVYVSHLINRKGTAEFAAAIEELVKENQDISIHVAGSGHYSDRIKKLEQKYSQIKFHGYISEKKKRELLTKGTIFVLPSYAEGLPIAILEAMAAGNAIVSTSVGSIPEVITKDGGIIVPPGDVDELHAALSSLCSSPTSVSLMGQHNRKKIEEEYSWKRVQHILLKLYIKTI